MKRKRLLIILSISALHFTVMQEAEAQAATGTFPDGTPIPAWFTETPDHSFNKEYVITSYGVKNDSALLQTAQIQAVIDKAFTAGGGVVVIPRGVFLSGSLFFKQGVHLRLNEGARLKGSDDIADYPIVKTRIEGQTLKYFAALVNADSLDGFSITGKGAIDGNGLRYWKAFWLRRNWNPQCTNMDEQRPRLIYVAHSSNVLVEGLHLVNSPFWTSHFYKCNNLKLLDLTITAGTKETRAPSSDGIDLDVCEMVLVKGCYIAVNDDAIALKGGKGPTADIDPNNGANRNIIIEDNTMERCPTLTLGSESVHTYNVILRRCTLKDADYLLHIKMRPDTPQKHEYITLEDARGSARQMLNITPWTQFFDLKGQPQPKSSVGNLTFVNCNIETNRKISIQDSEHYTLTDIIVNGEKIR